MPQRIFYDGFNLARRHGTGVATYARTLAGVAGELGYDVGIVYGVAELPAQAVSIADVSLGERPVGLSLNPRAMFADLLDQARCRNPIRPARLEISPHATAVAAYQRHAFAARNLFNNARRYFARTDRFVAIEFEQPPGIFHYTYPLPVRARQARNLYTIHDVISLKFPSAMNDNKRVTLSLLRQIARTADRIVTVSEASKRDIVEIVGADAGRITVTYQAVQIPPEAIACPESAVADRLDRRFGLDMASYLLFFGALEPKKNIRRLIEAYLLARPAIPLVLVTSGGWSNAAEMRLIEENKPAVRHVEDVDRLTLMTLIRGARAVLFPSLYEGFGLPVLEAMMLGVPVVTSREGALPEVAGDAAIYINPYDLGDMARAIAAVTEDAGLRAAYSARGTVQAEKYSLARYRQRVADLYESVS